MLPFYVLYKILIKDELKSKLEFNMYISIRKKLIFVIDRLLGLMLL